MRGHNRPERLSRRSDYWQWRNIGPIRRVLAAVLAALFLPFGALLFLLAILYAVESDYGEALGLASASVFSVIVGFAMAVAAATGRSPERVKDILPWLILWF